MPDLPTLTLTTKTETATILALFGDADGYLAWLAAAVRDEVERREARRLDEEANTAKAAALAAYETDLPPADVTP